MDVEYPGFDTGAVEVARRAYRAPLPTGSSEAR